MKSIFTFILCLCCTAILYAQQYQPSDEKSTVSFSIKNFGIATGGSFKGLKGTIEFNPASAGTAKFDISVDAGKVNTDNNARDNHLRKEEYFDAEKYPGISFVSAKITAKGSGFTVAGKLTIKGTTKDISFPFTAQPKDDGYLFEGSFQLNRRDFNVGGSSMVLGDNVTVNLSVFATKK